MIYICKAKLRNGLTFVAELEAPSLNDAYRMFESQIKEDYKSLIIAEQPQPNDEAGIPNKTDSN